MRTRILQLVGLLTALCYASFGAGAAIAQEMHSLAPKESPTATADNPFFEKSVSSKAVLLPAQDETADEADIRTSLSKSAVLTQKVRAALEKFGNLEYVEVPFIDVKYDIEESLGFNIQLDQTAIDDALTEEESVTIRLINVRYSDGLRLLLRDFNATYTVDNGIIRIISLDNANDAELHSRIMFDVQPTLDLIKKHDGRMNSPQYEGFDESVIPMIVLSDTIMSVVQKDAWRDNGQGEAALEIAGGILIVRGPESLLSEVKDFVQDLHAQMEARTH